MGGALRVMASAPEDSYALQKAAQEKYDRLSERERREMIGHIGPNPFAKNEES